MNFVIKSKGKIEYQTRKGLLKGNYIVKNIDIIITSKKPHDSAILGMHKKLIENEIIHYINNQNKAT